MDSVVAQQKQPVASEPMSPATPIADPTREIPPEIFDAAMQTYLEGRRLDMGELADQLGVSRATLYRRVKNRDQLLGAVIWSLMQRVFETAYEEAQSLTGVERIEAASRYFMTIVHAQAPFQRWLEQEPEAALRILTSKHGPIQASVVARMQALIAEEEQAGRLKLSIDRHTLAYVIVRIGESFLYADVIADNDPDLELAVKLIGRLLRG
jgi:AcrR family transcriptional regulator